MEKRTSAIDRKGLGVFCVHMACLFLSGTGVGWLVGLAASPVLHIIVAGVIAVIMGVVSAMAGIESSPRNKVLGDKSQSSETRLSGTQDLIKLSPVPMTGLIFGLVIGACLGVYTRTNEFLGANPQRLAQKWRGVGGLDEASVRRRLFDQLYPPAAFANGSIYEELPNGNEVHKEGENPPAVYGDGTSRQVGKREKTESGKPPSPTSAITSHTAGLFSISVEDCDLLSLKHGDTLRSRLRGLNKHRINAFLDRCSSDECLEALKEILCTDHD